MNRRTKRRCGQSVIDLIYESAQDRMASITDRELRAVVRIARAEAFGHERPDQWSHELPFVQFMATVELNHRATWARSARKGLFTRSPRPESEMLQRAMLEGAKEGEDALPAK